MIRDLIRNTKLRHAISDVIGLVCMVIVMVAWLFIVAALSPAEARGAEVPTLGARLSVGPDAAWVTNLSSESAVVTITGEKGVKLTPASYALGVNETQMSVFSRSVCGVPITATLSLPGYPNAIALSASFPCPPKGHGR